jgi:chaperonin GroEL
MLTTECMVAEAPKDDAPPWPAAAWGMGDMGGMGMGM